jgi:protein gp37
MAESSIEWTDATWNPVAGCSVLSPGCTNCYAMRMAARLEAMGMEKYAGLTRRSGRRAIWTGKISTDRKSLRAPLTWSKPRMVFVNSMADLFHDEVPADFIADVWDVMRRAQQHTFQILTKRPDRMAAMTANLPVLPNVWLGASVESADYVDRLDHLRRTRADIRFVSFEPPLGSVVGVDLTDIDWAIVGGESGPRARPMNATWVREIRDLCRQNGAAFFFKQWGGINKKRTGRQLDGTTWDEYPVTMPREGYVRRSASPDRARAY